MTALRAGVFLAAALLVAGGAWLVLRGGDDQSAPADSERVLLVFTDASDSSRLMAVDAAGANVAPDLLTESESVAVSPDGSWAVRLEAADRWAVGPVGAGLETGPGDGTSELPANDPPNGQPSFPPAGNLVALPVADPDVLDGSRIVVVDSTGEQVADLGPGSDPLFSPDGSKVAFNRAVEDPDESSRDPFDHPTGLVVTDVGAAGTETLVFEAEEAGLRALGFSPDIELLAFGDGFEAGVARVDGSGEANIFEATDVVQFSPDGTGLLFVGPKAGDENGDVTDLYLADPDGENAEVFAEEAVFGSFSPDGGLIAVATQAGLELRSADSADGTGGNILSPHPLGAPSFSPDSNLIAIEEASIPRMDSWDSIPQVAIIDTGSLERLQLMPGTLPHFPATGAPTDWPDLFPNYFDVTREEPADTA